MIDVHEPGRETTLRGELRPLGFRIDARIVGWDDQGAIAEAGLFLQWGGKA